jgi:hypothetical protein
MLLVIKELDHMSRPTWHARYEAFDVFSYNAMDAPVDVV